MNPEGNPKLQDDYGEQVSKRCDYRRHWSCIVADFEEEGKGYKRKIWETFRVQKGRETENRFSPGYP